MKITGISGVFIQKINKLNINPITFKSTSIPFQQNDDFESRIAKFYHDGNGNLINPNTVVQKGEEVFVNGEKLANYKIVQKDYKSNSTRITQYSHGHRFIDKRLKDGVLIQEDVYGYRTNERAVVNKYLDNGEFDYSIARNFRFDTRFTPAFLLTKKTPEGTMQVWAELKEKEDSIGYFSVNLKSKENPLESKLTIKKDGEYDFSAARKEDFEALQKVLIELKAIIQSDDMKKDFGQYERFNEELDRAIEFSYFVLGNKEN